MFVYRGEKLKDESYLKVIRDKHNAEYDALVKFYSKKLEEARIKKEELMADVNGEMKAYQIYVKPIKELTRKEKENIIFQYESMQEAFGGKVERKQTGYSDDDIDLIRQTFKPTSPLEKVESDIEFYNRMLVEAKREHSKQFTIALNRNAINEENVNEIIKYITKAKEREFGVTVCIDCVEKRKNIDGVDYIFTKKDLELLVQLDNCLISNGYSGLRITEFIEVKDLGDLRGTWTLQQVVNANNKIDDVARHIKEHNLSPFEAMTYIHRWASNFIYNGKMGLQDGRVLPSTLNTDNIVCSGYASMVKAVVDKLEMPGLKCELTGCYLIIDGSPNGHCHNIVTIDDPKYDINGTYIEDACWDSKKKGNEQPEGYAHCLYPVTDLECFNNGVRYYSLDREDRYSNLIVDPKNLEEHYNISKENWLRKMIWKISKSKAYKSRAKIVEMYKENSEPISIEKYEQALRIMYGTVCDDQDKVEEYVLSSIDSSKNKSIYTFNPKAKNSFANSVIKVERKKQEKKSKGPKAVL